MLAWDGHGMGEDDERKGREDDAADAHGSRF